MKNINYSVGPIKLVMGKQAGKVAYRPYLQTNGTMTLDDIAEHMSEHNSKYDEGDVNAVLKQFIKCATEMILGGYKISLDGLGVFRPSIKATISDSADEVTADNITSLSMAWSPGEKTKKLKEKATFNLVSKRKNQQLLVSAEKNGQTSMTLTQSGGSSGNGGGVSGE